MYYVLHFLHCICICMAQCDFLQIRLYLHPPPSLRALDNPITSTTRFTMTDTSTSAVSSTTFLSDEKLEIFNEENAHHLVIIIWNQFQRRNAVSAKMVSVNDKGFSIEAQLLTGVASKIETKRFLHQYELPVRDEEEFLSYFRDLTKRANAPCLQVGYSTIWAWFCLSMWMMLIARIVGDEEKISPTSVFYGYYVVFKSSTVFFPTDKTPAIYALILLIVSHGVEAIYVASVCVSLGFGYVAIMSWSLATFFVGYPVLNRIQHLEKLKTSKGGHLKNA